MQPIAPSELIINNRGAIYHLNVKPEELATTVITVGDPDRVKEVSKYFDSIELKTGHREFITHTGMLGNKRLSVISTGIGTDNIDIVLNELDALVNIDFVTRTIKEKLTSLSIIRIGTSGSLQPDVPVDSFVVSLHAIGLDNLLNFYRTQQNDEELVLLQTFLTHTQPGMQVMQPYVGSAGISLMKHFVHGFHHGITITCGVLRPQGRVLRLGIKNPEFINSLTSFNFGRHQITNFEMETAAIYSLGTLLGHHCVSLSAIVANRVKKEFSKDGNAATDRLIKHALQIISSIP